MSDRDAAAARSAPGPRWRCERQWRESSTRLPLPRTCSASVTPTGGTTARRHCQCRCQCCYKALPWPQSSTKEVLRVRQRSEASERRPAADGRLPLCSSRANSYSGHVDRSQCRTSRSERNRSRTQRRPLVELTALRETSTTTTTTSTTTHAPLTALSVATWHPRQAPTHGNNCTSPSIPPHCTHCMANP